jgi:hypothetical protein
MYVYYIYVCRAWKHPSNHETSILTQSVLPILSLENGFGERAPMAATYGEKVVYYVT